MGGGVGAALFVGYTSLDVLTDGAYCAILAYAMLTQEADVLALSGFGQMAERVVLLDVCFVVA